MSNNPLQQKGWIITKILNYDLLFSIPRLEKELSLIKLLKVSEDPLLKIRTYFNKKNGIFDPILFKSIFGFELSNHSNLILTYLSGVPSLAYIVLMAKEIKIQLGDLINLEVVLIEKALHELYSEPKTIYSLEDFFICVNGVLINSSLAEQANHLPLLLTKLNSLPLRTRGSLQSKDLEVLFENSESQAILNKIYNRRKIA